MRRSRAASSSSSTPREDHQSRISSTIPNEVPGISGIDAIAVRYIRKRDFSRFLLSLKNDNDSCGILESFDPLSAESISHHGSMKLLFTVQRVRHILNLFPHHLVATSGRETFRRRALTNSI